MGWGLRINNLGKVHEKKQYLRVELPLHLKVGLSLQI